MSPPIPSRVGRYEIARRLGEGGMGVLYLARDPLLERSVAIKMLSVHSAELAQRFSREARSAAALKHPNIVTMYDVGEEGGTPFIAMEYVEGETLADIIRRRVAMGLLRKIQLLCELCAGLGFAHRSGIVHRDIKPANVMVAADGSVKILDFGLARLMGDMSDAGLTGVGTVLGTPHYLSPEQVGGKPADHRSDIWAFGLVAYELLTFEKAYPGDTPHSVMHQIASREPRPLGAVLRGVDQELETVIATTTRHSPEDRYQTLATPLERLGRIRDRLARHASDDTVVLSNEGRLQQPVSNPPSDATPRNTPRLGNLQVIAQRRADQIAAHLTKAREQLQDGAFDAAIELCELAAVIDPQHPEMLDVLDQVHRALDDRNVRTWLEEARARLSDGLLSQAEALIARSLELRPELAEAADLLEAVHNRRAEIELQRERARRLSAALVRAQDSLADAAFEAAVRAANEALAIESGHTEALEIKRRAAAGIEERVRRDVEERAESLQIRANALVFRGDYTGALNLLKAFKQPHHGIDRLLATVAAEIQARDQRREEEERRRAEEQRRREEEVRASEEARRREEEEARLREQEQRRREKEDARRREEEARAREEARRREEEAARLREQEQRRREEEDARRRAEEAKALEAARLREEARLEEETRRREAERQEKEAAWRREEEARAREAARVREVQEARLREQEQRRREEEARAHEAVRVREEARRREEEAKALEASRLREEARLEEEARRREAEQQEKEAARRREEEAKALEAARLREEARLEEEARRREAERQEKEAARRRAEEARALEAARLRDEARLEEEARRREAERQEKEDARRRAEEARALEAARLREEARLEEEARRREAERQEKEAARRRAEEAKALEARLQEEARLEEEARRRDAERQEEAAAHRREEARRESEETETRRALKKERRQAAARRRAAAAADAGAEETQPLPVAESASTIGAAGAGDTSSVVGIAAVPGDVAPSAGPIRHRPFWQWVAGAAALLAIATAGVLYQRKPPPPATPAPLEVPAATAPAPVVEPAAPVSQEPLEPTPIERPVVDVDRPTPDDDGKEAPTRPGDGGRGGAGPPVTVAREPAPPAPPVEKRLAQARAFESDGKFDEALREYEAILTVSPGNASAVQGRDRARAEIAERNVRVNGYVRRARNKFDEAADYDAALADLRLALQLAPGHAEARELLARVEKAKAAEESVVKRRRQQD